MKESVFALGPDRRCRRLLVRASDDESAEENDEDDDGTTEVEDGEMTVVFSPLLFGFPSSSSSSVPHSIPSSSSSPPTPLSTWVIPEIERTSADTPSIGVGFVSSSAGVMKVTLFDLWTPKPPPVPSPDSLSSSDAMAPSSFVVSLEEE